MCASFSSGDVSSIRFVGSGAEFIKFINNLVEDFLEPHFGYNGEYYDEN